MRLVCVGFGLVITDVSMMGLDQHASTTINAPVTDQAVHWVLSRSPGWSENMGMGLCDLETEIQLIIISTLVLLLPVVGSDRYSWVPPKSHPLSIIKEAKSQLRKASQLAWTLGSMNRLFGSKNTTPKPSLNDAIAGVSRRSYERVDSFYSSEYFTLTRIRLMDGWPT